jgi:peptidoglycan hydrolase CwlO-like protein
MALFNKILNILMLVLAGAAVWFGVLLFQKREELRNRGDYMAKVINEVSAKLDENSGTEINKNLLPNASVVKNPNSAKVSLYHDNYKNLTTVLKGFKSQVDEIMAQRDALSDTLHSAMSLLEIPDADSFAAIEFESVEKYPEKDKAFKDVVQKVDERDNAIIAKIGEAATAMGFSADGDAIKSLDGYDTPLTDFVTKSQALKTRSDAYAQSIGQMCSTWGISSPSLDGDDYSSALSSAQGEMSAKKADYDKTKAELEAANKKIIVLNDKITAQMEEITSLEKERDSWRDKYKKLAGDINTGPGKTIDVVKLLEGKVLKVDKKWGFVVIDLGKHNTVMLGKNKDKPRDVALPENRKMDVARGEEYIGQIKVVDVNDNCAIADIIPEAMKGKIAPGDKVFFARLPKKVEKKAGEGDDAGAAEGDASAEDAAAGDAGEDAGAVEEGDAGDGAADGLPEF